MPSPRALLEYCEAEKAWQLNTIEALVTLESPSDDKAAVDRCGGALTRRLTQLGARVGRIPSDSSGDHVLAEIGSGARRILLLGHFDTVWPLGTLMRMPFELRGGRLHGPGVYDMKAGMAIGMQAVRALQALDALKCTVALLFTADEEVGSPTSRALVEEEARRADAVLVLEPALPNGGVKTGRKGVGAFRVEIVGVASHAGLDPDRGASAIHELARRITAITALARRDLGTTVNVGVVSGGTRPNVVAEHAHALVDVRVESAAEASRVAAAMAALRPDDPRTRIAVTGGFNRPPMERSAAVLELYEHARQVAESLGRDLPEGVVGGASDGNFTAALGIPTIDGLGAIGGGAHAIDEHVLVQELPARAALVAGLIARLR